MQLTKGQKDALVHKALDIVNKKRAEKKSELVAHWKPSHKAKAVLDNIKEIEKLALKLYSSLEAAGFTKEYNSWSKTVDGHSFSISLYDLYDGREVCKKAENELMNKCIETKLQKETNYPDVCAILDEIELLNLSKEFKMDEFLAKYNNL